jgi:hypothetical protein
MHKLTRSALAPLGLLGGLLIALPGAALAQGSVGAPAGTEPAATPGGTEGRAGPRNEQEAIRSGDAIPVPPGARGAPVEPPPAPADLPPPRRP